jgi:two-component system NarL family response regulator
MSEPNDPWRHLAPALVIQLYQTLRLRQRDEPTPERAQVLEDLRPIRDHLVHGTPPYSPLPSSAERLLSDLAQSAETSLGTPGAQRLRRQTTPRQLAAILGREADTSRPVGKRHKTRDPVRVLIVDDHGLFRWGLEATLQLEPDIDVVGEAGDGGDALVKAQELLPDVVLMDVKMPRRGGIEACTAIKQAVPSARIVMLTMSDEEADLYEAVKAGASGYLLKEIPVDELAGSIRAVYDGQSLINPSLASKLLTEFATMSKRGSSPQSVPAPRLTNREMEVLRAVARGLNNREIARELFISENTVKNHIRNILEKLQLHSRMEAVVYAVREKLLEIT